MDALIETFVKEENRTFHRHHLQTPAYQIESSPKTSNDEDKTKDKINHPGYQFYFKPQLTIKRSFEYDPPNQISRDLPKKELFSFEQGINPELAKLSFKEKLKYSPPLNSMFNGELTKPIIDNRIDVDTLNPCDIKEVYCKFNEITCTPAIIEPIMVTCFLYDVNESRKISQQWTFLPSSTKTNGACSSLVKQCILEASESACFPTTTQHKQVAFIISLDRLFLKDGGESAIKYIQKPNKSTEKALGDDIRNCKQQFTSLTFAYCAVPVQGIIPQTGRTIDLEFCKFYNTQTVSDEFLKSALESGFEHPKEKVLPYKLNMTFTLDPIEGCDYMKDFFSNSKAVPYKTFDNRLFIHIKHAHFKFPHGIRGRNIVVRVKLFTGEKFIDLQEDSDTFTSRSQYHVDNPSFHDEIVVHLPPELPTRSELYINFFHASVKPNAKNQLEPCGSAKFGLFENGCFVRDGLHSVPINYPNTPELNTPANQFCFTTMLFSSIYSSDRFITDIYDGIFSHDAKSSKPDPEELKPHLFAVLDTLITKICDGEVKAFASLVALLGCFQHERNHKENLPLIYYVKYIAFGNETVDLFHPKCIMLWTKYIEDNNTKNLRPDITCAWFLFELIIKSIVKHRDREPDGLTSLIKRLMPPLTEYNRNKGRTPTKNLNIYITNFFKDLVEVTSRKHTFKLVADYLSNTFKLTENMVDRECFRDFITHFLTPKIFLFTIIPPRQNTTYFKEYILPLIASAMHIEQHTNMVFEVIFRLLCQFTPAEHEYIVPRIRYIVDTIGESVETLLKYKNRANHVYPFVVAHFILANEKVTELSQKWAAAAQLLLTKATHLTAAEREQVIKTAAKDTINVETLASNIVHVNDDLALVKEKNQRRFASLKRPAHSQTISKQKAPGDVTIVRTFDALAFCVQTTMIQIIEQCANEKKEDYNGVRIVNCIIARFFDIQISPYLKLDFLKAAQYFADRHSHSFYADANSNMKHIIRRIIQNPDEESLELLNAIHRSESSHFKETSRTDALVTRALYKCPPTEETVNMMKNIAPFAEITERLYNVNRALMEPDLEKGNQDIYASLLFEKAALVAKSPDSRIDQLLLLAEHQASAKYRSEAVMAWICAAAIVAEYMTMLGRLPPALFGADSKHPARAFRFACPSAESEVCPDDCVSSLPRVRGFCTSKYFTEYGLMYLIQSAMEQCKIASLFELLNRIHVLLVPIAQYRHLWNVLKKQYQTGSQSWLISSKFFTSSDRNLGSYYKVEFQDRGVFIYRETDLSNLWSFSSKIEKASKYYAKDRKVEIKNEGEGLDPSKFEDGKYMVHVKFVNQYFTPEERKRRVTVFEQNHNITHFSFDIPISKNGQSSIENCQLKRTIFELPHPLPYLTSCVRVPPENITQIIFEPIEYACENLKVQVSKIQEACARRNFYDMQMLLQGTLLVTVNEGPAKMAEVFLKGNDTEGERKLREIYREFIDSITTAVNMYGIYVNSNPSQAVVQEQLVIGLSKLTSKLQPYLK